MGTVRFAHLSVKEFFATRKENGDALFTTAFKNLALACLRYLTLNDFAQDRPPPEDEIRRRMDDMSFS
jgi:hypothetical protein